MDSSWRITAVIRSERRLGSTSAPQPIYKLMLNLWNLGGLSLKELLWPTARESWEDEVFGQAARLAFYHLLGLFPALLLAVLVLVRLEHTGSGLLETL